MRKVMIVFGLSFIICSIILPGCRKKSEEEQIEEMVGKEEKKEKKEATERVKNQNKFFGRYLTDDPEEYLELKKDGTFEQKLRPGTSGISAISAVKVTGEWEIKNDKILFSQPWLPPGYEVMGKGEIEGDTIIDSDGKIWRKQGGKADLIEEKTVPGKRITKSQIIGKYILERGIENNTKKDPGILIFEKDGAIKNTLSGGWEIKDDRLILYERNKRVWGGRILDDSIENDYKYIEGRGIRGFYNPVKKEGAKIIKTLEVKVSVKPPSSGRAVRRERQRRVAPGSGGSEEAVSVIPATELKKITVWSDYVSSDIGSFNLKLKENGTFSMSGLLEETWRIENGFVELYEDNEVLGRGRMEGNNIIFERFRNGERRISRFIRQ